MPCGWEGNRRSGVALAMHHKLGGLSTYGLKGLTKLREISTPLMALVGVGTHYLVYQISGSGSINVRGSDRLYSQGQWRMQRERGGGQRSGRPPY